MFSKYKIQSLFHLSLDLLNMNYSDDLNQPRTLRIKPKYYVPGKAISLPYQSTVMLNV